MKSAKAKVTQALALILCVALFVWSIQPSTSHVPAVLDVLVEHAQMIEDHGHSHGLEEDLAWAMHGHSHDKLDHDHSSVVLTDHPQIRWSPAERPAEALALVGWQSHAPNLLERPPRV